MARTIEVAVTLKLIASKELSHIIVDSTVQENAIAHPTGNKLLETARIKLVEVAKAEGIDLKQAYAKEGQLLGYKAGRYAHAGQFKRMRKVIKRPFTQTRSHKTKDKLAKLNNWHSQEVECISKLQEPQPV